MKFLKDDGSIDIFKTIQKIKQEISNDVAKYVHEYLKTKMILDATTDEQTLNGQESD